jgi:G3E family GTPase
MTARASFIHRARRIESIAMNPAPLPVTVLSGHQGAGKSTLLDALFDNEDLRIGVVTSPENASIETIERAIVTLAEQENFDAIVVEAPESIDALEIAEQLAFGDDDAATLAGRAHLDTFVTVIDASRFLRDYASTDTLAPGDAHDDGRTIVEALVDQLEFCDAVVINKTDLVGAEEVDTIARMIGALNPRARQLRAEHGRVPSGQLVNTGLFDLDTTSSAPGWLAILNGHLPASVDATSAHFVYRARRPFHPGRLWRLLHQEWPDVIRAKGFFWLATRGEVGGSLSQAGGTCRHGPAGVWWAAQDRSEWPTDDPELEAEIVAEWYGDPDDNSIGDRRQELVLIGLDLDAAWQERFDACLLDDAEWALGPDGWRRFDDPFPAWDIDEHDHDDEHEHGPDCGCDDHRHDH